MGTDTDIFVLKREADKEPFRFQVGDDVLSIAHSADLDQFAMVDLFGNEKVGDLTFMLGLFKLGMTDDDYTKLRAAKPQQKKLAELYSKYLDHCGMSQGESPASSD